MSGINRALSASEQRHLLQFSYADLGFTNGETGTLAYVPFPCVLEAGNICAFSQDGSPSVLLNVSRFIVGQGVTTWNLGTTFVLPSFGTSGVLTSGVSLPASGSTLLMLMANDVIGLVAGGGVDAASFDVAGCFVVRPVQDVRVFLGIL